MSTKTAAFPGHHGKAAKAKHTKHWLAHYQSIWKVVKIAVPSILLLVIVVQLLYPHNRALPFMSIGGLDVSLKDQEAIAAQLNEFAQKGEVKLSTPSRTWHTTWQTIGLTVDQDASVRAALQYEWWERLLPFSSLIRASQSHSTSLIALVDTERLRAFAEKIAAEDKAAAKDATIAIKDGQVQIDEAKSGYAFTVAEIQRQVSTVPMLSNASLTLLPDPVPFVRSKAELQALATTTEQLLSRQLSLKVIDKTFRPTRAQIGAWLTFGEDAAKKLTVQVNRDALRGYLEQIDKEVKIEPGTSTVTLLDGQEVARTLAVAGRTVAVDASLGTIEAELRSTAEPKPLTLSVANVPPKVNHVRTYSQANSGLQALIRDWEAANYGDYGIVVREIGGAGRYGDWQPDKRFVTASTYKMFLAYTVFIKMEQGQVTPGQKTDMGWTVDACIREMIVNSTNPCAISLQNLIGWETVDNMLRDAGFGATILNNRTGGDKFTTVREETNFLLRLNAGTLMNREHTDYLLSLLKRQVWRAGIPSGVPRGTVVADKVGLYGSWVHDVAIVYSPRATYILGIMSRGGSDPQFADLSRRVYNFFNQ